MAYVSSALRQQVALAANFRCEYCQSAQLTIGGPMHIEHIRPDVRGGLTTFSNLAYSCARCNLHKSSRTHFRDPISLQIVPLFNPGHQRWTRHFEWSEDGTRILGRTRTGRAAVLALHMNELEIVRTRSFWVHLGIHPPS